MKKLIAIIAILFRHIVFGQQVSQVNDPVEWINPFMGIDSKFEMSNGNTHPAIALHRGMHFWVPQTGRRHINPHPG